MALARHNSVRLGGTDVCARRDHATRMDITQKPEIEIELTESAPTIQQQQAYERFWKMFFERVVTKRQLDKKP